MDYLYNSKEISNFYPLDKQGFLKPQIEIADYSFGLDKIIIDLLIYECVASFGESLISIYFKGTNLIDSYNAFNIVVIVTDNCMITTEEMTAHLQDKLSKKFYNTLPTLNVIKISNLRESRFKQFIIQVLSIRVYGLSIEMDFEGFRPSKSIVFYLPTLKEEFLTVKSYLSNKRTYKKPMIIYFVKFLIRCSFELVVDLEKQFTRDLTLCQSIFSKYYVQHKDISYCILNHYNKNDASLFLRDAEIFYNILLNEFEKKN